MARAENTQLVERFQTFYREYYKDAIGELARQYPTGRKSLYIEWQDLYQFDPDLADDVRAQPGQLREYAEEALRLYDLPADVSLSDAHVRIKGLPETTEIREIRADHRGRLLAVRGIVRKATDVRPKITEAAFECQRCGTLTRIPQTGGEFQEPHECQGCERQGPFRINFDQSAFIDAQKIRVQESPEGLRGGETPQSIDISIEDDVTGKVTAGDNVTVTGILRLDQQGNEREQSPMFDVFMDGMTVEVEDEQFEEMDIADEEKSRIVELANDPDIYEKMVGAIAPSIYGYDDQKLAMVLQLFSGVTKHLPDGSRIRGDLHMLLIGDPGTGKCLSGETNVRLADGRQRQIRDVVEEHLDDPVPVDDGVYDTVDIPLPSLSDDGLITERRATKVWKREAPAQMYRIRTASGRQLDVTPSHPLYVQDGGAMAPIQAECLEKGDFIATANVEPNETTDIDVSYPRPGESPAATLDLPNTWRPWLARLVGYITAEDSPTLVDSHSETIRIRNTDEAIIEDACDTFDRLGVAYTVAEGQPARSESEVRCTASEVIGFLEHLEPTILDSSAQQRVPDDIRRAGTPIHRAFLRAFVAAQGHVSTNQQELTVASRSHGLLKEIRSLLLSMDICATLDRRPRDSYRLCIDGSDFERYVREVGFVSDRKTEAAFGNDDRPRDTDRDVIPVVGDTLKQVRTALGLTQHDCGVPRTTYRQYESGNRNPSREPLNAVIDAFEERLEWLHEQ
ncbi:MAG: LAGLIDADG family homing endonuclease, partial [Salinirussus sp.]